ncbi:MAG: glycine zipper family protein [Taibaiella sp.]|nr:glycine zipper family protein [Taibaiella sp.]
MKKLISIIAIATVFVSCNNAGNQANLAAKQHTIDSMQAASERQHAIDSMNQLATVSQKELQQQQAQTAAVAAAAAARPVHTRTIIREHRVYEPSNNSTATTTTTTTQAVAPAAAPQRKGWSAKAKGALIGAGAGAITGAMIDGRKGEGAVVGGLIGAAAGLGTGAIIDGKKKK